MIQHYYCILLLGINIEPIQIMTSCNLENENLQMKKETQELTSFKYLIFFQKNDWLWQDSIRPIHITAKRQLQQFNLSNPLN